ncbi:RAD55 family ATPase [Halospeciosus flavus]|uniref:RAD55 family ATPase n=1 Tax=Halospeciosus flavus TaxID=3032283 RepID=A0ABD5Z1Y0_9EURY|nr:HTR-like protein [Halospeciosus flavus]
MERIPFGISRLDKQIGGGAPKGSLVLLVGEEGAGAREFLYTSATMNGLAHNDPDLFDLHYGSIGKEAALPESVHYVSFTQSETQLQNEIGLTIDDEIREAGLDPVSFVDLSPEYFRLSPVPREWYAGEHRAVTDIGKDASRRDVIETFADYLDANAPGNLVAVDSLSDLVESNLSDMPWSDVVMLLKGLRRAVHDWDALVLMHVSREALTDTQLGDLMTAVDGTIQFEWETGGNERVRTMYVRVFRGVLSQLEEEDIIRFETEIHEAGFDISNVRKIR